MGNPNFSYKEIPVFYEEDESIKMKIEDEDYEFFPISMGNPHVVCFKKNIDEIELKKIGKIVENYKYFPNKTNVEFVQIIDDKNIKLRVWERGVGETLSCGTGATSGAIIANKNGLTNNEVNVKIKGGNLKVIFDKNAYLIGEAENVFEGSIEL